MSEAEYGSDHPFAGVVARAEKYWKHERFFGPRNRAVDTVMFPLTAARSVVNQHGNADTFFGPRTTVVTDNFVQDGILESFDKTEKREILRQFSPDYHIPEVRSVYSHHDEAEQQRRIDTAMEETEWIASELADTPTKILVQMKGWKRWHFKRCLSKLRTLSTDFCVFYGSGYAGPGIGNRLYDLIDDSKTMIRVVDPEGVLLVGRQSPRDLRKFPPEVVAAAGKRWIEESEQDDGLYSQEQFRTWADSVEPTLGSGQTRIGTFASNGVVADG
jgi:hypothetical protein